MTLNQTYVSSTFLTRLNLNLPTVSLLTYLTYHPSTRQTRLSYILLYLRISTPPPPQQVGQCQLTSTTCTHYIRPFQCRSPTYSESVLAQVYSTYLPFPYLQVYLSVAYVKTQKYVKLQVNLLS